ncbi:MAG: hypothetical protein M3275_03480 [Thermoproteota archaeon]|nr:hypothetical protein [Thermoproteota archaeon]
MSAEAAIGAEPKFSVAPFPILNLSAEGAVIMAVVVVVAIPDATILL